MKKIIFLICFIGVFVIASSQADAVKSHTKKTEDGKVETTDEVVVTISEPVIKSRDISLGQFKAELERERILRDGYIASVIAMEVELPLVQAEADTVLLDTP